MKALNWPHASLGPVTGPCLVEATWWDEESELSLAELDLKYTPGAKPSTKLKNIIWASFDERVLEEDPDEWDISVEIPSISKVLTFSKSEHPPHRIMFQQIEDFLELYKDYEWQVVSRTWDSFGKEWISKIGKIGLGPLVEGNRSQKSVSWPQNSSPSTGAYLVQASSNVMRMDLSEVPLHRAAGENDIQRMSNLIRINFYEWVGVDESDVMVDDWRLYLRPFLPKEDDDLRGIFQAIEYGPPPSYLSTPFEEMFQEVEGFLEKYWDREWEVSFWTTGDTYEWRARKIGLGPLREVDRP